MTRVITSNEIKPDMTIRWETGGITHECEVEAVTPSLASGAVDVDAVGDGYMRIERSTLITVLSEPKSVQPEEPTEFGAKVIVDGRQFLRAPLHSSDPTPWLSQLDGIWRDWDYLINMGPVTVIPDLGWTVPDNDDTLTPEAPDRIEEWPEDDTALRVFPWKDRDGDIWRHIRPGWKMGPFPQIDEAPSCGPWTRVDE